MVSEPVSDLNAFMILTIVGPIVRIAPNLLLISDPKMLPVI